MNPAAAELPALLTAPPRRTLAVAESLTGGRVQALITAVSGASAYFLGGVIAYAIASKVSLLGVDREHATATGGVSERVAGEMAAGVCRRFGADFGVATTGYAEPAPAQGVAVPFAWIAVARREAGGPRVVWCRRQEFPDTDRAGAQAQAAAAAVAALLEVLRGPS